MHLENAKAAAAGLCAALAPVLVVDGPDDPQPATARHTPANAMARHAIDCDVVRMTLSCSVRTSGPVVVGGW
jgi:hypothetical protein